MRETEREKKERERERERETEREIDRRKQDIGKDRKRFSYKER